MLSSNRERGGKRSLDVVIVCHTEFGYATNQVVFDYEYKQGATDGVKNTILISDRFGAIVSFMVKPEVLESVSDLDFGNHEIGLHIHPNDSFLMHKEVGGEEDNLRGYAFDKQRAMIATGKSAVHAYLDIVPKTFVAGKWSVGNETVRALVELGFSHDASGCPKFTSSCCDWRKLPRICAPYKPSRDDYQAAGDITITMVPVSKEITTGVISPESNIGLGFLRAAVREYVKLNVPLLHIAFHSPALTSPRFQRSFRELLQLTSDFKANYRPLSEIEPLNGMTRSYHGDLSQYLRNLDTAGLRCLVHSTIRNARGSSVRRLERYDH